MNVEGRGGSKSLRPLAHLSSLLALALRAPLAPLTFPALPPPRPPPSLSFPSRLRPPPTTTRPPFPGASRLAGAGAAAGDGWHGCSLPCRFVAWTTPPSPPPSQRVIRDDQTCKFAAAFGS